MQLPLSEYTEPLVKEYHISFKSDKGAAHFFIKEAKEPIVYDEIHVDSFDHRLAVLSSTPGDISFFNSRRKNMKAAINQFLKTIAIPIGGLRKVLAIQKEDLRALCTLSEKLDNGYSAHATLFNQDDTVSIEIILNHYNDANNLKADLLAILGGIKTPYQGRGGTTLNS